MFLKTNRKRGKLVLNSRSIKKIIHLKKNTKNHLLFPLQIRLISLHNLLAETTMTTNLTEIRQDLNHAWEETH